MAHGAVEFFGMTESLGPGPDAPVSQESLGCWLQVMTVMGQISQPPDLEEHVCVCVCGGWRGQDVGRTGVCMCVRDIFLGLCYWRDGPIFGFLFGCHMFLGSSSDQGQSSSRPGEGVERSIPSLVG